MAKETTVRKRRRWPWIVAGTLVLIVVVLIWLMPTIIVSIDYAPLTFDLSPKLHGLPDGLVSNNTVTVNYAVSRDSDGRYVIHMTGHVLDWPYTAWVNVQPSFRLSGVDVVGDASFRLEGTRLMHLLADFTASTSGEWHADVNMEKTDFSESDPVIAKLLSRLQMPAISNLVFNGTLSLSAKAEKTAAVPVPKWTAVCNFANVSAACDANGGSVQVDNLNLRAGAFGIADHVDINPLHPRAERVTAAGFTLSNVFATVQSSEMSVLVTNRVPKAHDSAKKESLSKTNVVRRILVVTEAGASVCGGEARLYSFVNSERTIKATLSLDGVDAGQMLKHLNGFSGEASGALYGKMPLTYRKRERRLMPGIMHLHSVPGEKGKLKIYDPKPVVDNLAMGGIDQVTCSSLSIALKDLTYDVLKISLSPEDDDRQALTVKISGKSEQANVTIPVTLEVTFHGELDKLLNTGLRTFNR